MAAAIAGVSTVLIPEGNMRDLTELDPDAVAALKIIPCRTLADVLQHALTDGLPTGKARAVRPTAARRHAIAETAKNA